MLGSAFMTCDTVYQYAAYMLESSIAYHLPVARELVEHVGYLLVLLQQAKLLCI
jgi:hypothetical protein